jgi:hypothetical protein
MQARSWAYRIAADAHHACRICLVFPALPGKSMIFVLQCQKIAGDGWFKATAIPRSPRMTIKLRADLNKSS